MLLISLLRLLTLNARFFFQEQLRYLASSSESFGQIGGF
jgi:hypothetical protein